jgi:hypothetical protein
MQPDPIIHLWMHEQELGRTMKQNALERAARDADKPGARYRVARFGISSIRSSLDGLRRALRPAGTGSA